MHNVGREGLQGDITMMMIDDDGGGDCRVGDVTIALLVNIKVVIIIPIIIVYIARL